MQEPQQKLPQLPPILPLFPQISLETKKLLVPNPINISLDHSQQIQLLYSKIKLKETPITYNNIRKYHTVDPSVIEPIILKNIKKIRLTAKEDPKLLKEIMYCIQDPTKYESILEDQISVIFKNHFTETKTLESFISEASFMLRDLIDIHQYVQPICYPILDVFHIFKKNYTNQFISYVTPFLHKFSDQYGALMSLIDFLDVYDQQLLSLKESAPELNPIRLAAQSHMPAFIDHTQTLLQDYLSRSIYKDTSEKCTENYILSQLDPPQPLISDFPNDLFHYLNTQIGYLKGKLNKSLYQEFLRASFYTIKPMVLSLLDQISHPKSSIEQLMKIQFFNNFLLLFQYSHETRKAQDSELDFLFLDILIPSIQEGLDYLAKEIAEWGGTEKDLSILVLPGGYPKLIKKGVILNQEGWEDRGREQGLEMQVEQWIKERNKD